MLRTAILTALVLVGGLLFAPQVQGGQFDLSLANVYRGEVDLAHYWVSEKLDGVRARWDGEALYSRRGNRFNAPGWFVAGFPEVALDGELWMGRGTFEILSGAVRRQTPDDQSWRRIRFMVFDLPESSAPFDQRLVELRAILDGAPPSRIALVRQFRVSGEAELMAALDRVVAEGGEGLMLRDGRSRYRGGRNDDLLKLKTYEDAEAVVVGHLPGKGKFAGMMGSLLVETPDGHRFRIGTGFSDAERRDPPPVGATVTYQYTGRTANGIPRFASFLRIRHPPDAGMIGRSPQEEHSDGGTAEGHSR